ncbi:MAG: PDZ domain-containing protein [Gemmatimonadota bacterium]
MTRTLRIFLATTLITLPAPALHAQGTRLLRQPTVSAERIAFTYANDIWVVGRGGGDARRITSFQGQETQPHFSPDGRWLAFSAQYGGNTDVYVVPAEGGEPRRLTWHPAGDVVQGWSPDGARVLFASGRTDAPSGNPTFWTVALEGGLPEELPLGRAARGSLSPDGRRLAYQMVSPWEEEFRNYRGGQVRPVWIVDLDDLELDTPPWDGSNDLDPVWLGETVYFLSDRDWAANVWAYHTGTRELRQVTRHTDYDVKSLDAGGGVLAYEQGGWIHLLDPASGESRRVEIHVRGDFPWLVERWEDVGNRLTNPALSPTGKRAIFEARGEIFTVPVDEGDWRNLTLTPGVAERTPSWSPDGERVAWFSDASGEYRLVIAGQDGTGERREIPLESGTFYYTPAWSPDGSRILFTDTDLNLWVVDVASGRNTLVDTDRYMVPARTLDPVWSPDSKWIAYAKRLPTQLHAVHVYDVENARVHQVTDGLADAFQPAWDRSGKYLWFMAGTDFGLNTGWLDMTSYDRPASRTLYLVVLAADGSSPLLPETGDESARGARADTSAAADSAGAAGTGGTRGGRAAAPEVRIDFAGLAERIVAVGEPARDYAALTAGTEGKVFYRESRPGQSARVMRYDLAEREAVEFVAGASTFTLSADGKKILLRQGSNWRVVDADRAPPSGNGGTLAVGGVRMRVDPRAEFAQMFAEGWRFQRDYLYVPNLHGADFDSVMALYAPLAEHVAHRSDLTYLLDVMGGEVSIGHSFVRGGDVPDVDRVDVGLLGADLEVADGHYRIARIYTGDAWSPGLTGPLAAPGLGIDEGDYILAVNGVALAAPANPYALFEGTSGRQTILRVNDAPTDQGARHVTVVPTGSETGLRRAAWIEDNRRRVEELSGGRLAYVWIPNTSTGGYDAFNRWYYAQQDRPGAVIDERFNSGGSAADYIVELMNREIHGYFNNPVGERTPFTSPAAGIWGPKVMIINEMAGSGGDLMPYMFRYYDVGPLVGTRTWGGLVGTWDTPPLLDGGSMIAPRGGFFDVDGAWAVENEGVAPDIQVEMTPAAVAAGRDPQLERAVAEALRLLEENPVVLQPEPPFPNKWRRPGGGGR